MFEFNDAKALDDNLPVMTSFPATHFWEYGQFLDLCTDGELIRDHLLRGATTSPGRWPRAHRRRWSRSVGAG